MANSTIDREMANMLRPLMTLLNPEVNLGAFSCGGSVDCDWATSYIRNPTSLCTIAEADDYEKQTVNAESPGSLKWVERWFDDTVQGLKTFDLAPSADEVRNYTSFNPYSPGMMESITKLLFPQAPRGIVPLCRHLVVCGQGDSINFEKYRADLEDDMFLPRIGYLWVDLSHPHTGGAITVSKGGISVNFDWSSAAHDEPDYQWAAFTDDCDVRMDKVASGNKFTLMYTLHLREQTPMETISDASQGTSIYSQVLKSLESDTFLPNGATIGLYCTTDYAHTHSKGISALPEALEGVDMAVYQAFKSEDCEIELRACLLSDCRLNSFYEFTSRAANKSHEHDIKIPPSRDAIHSDGVVVWDNLWPIESATVLPSSEIPRKFPGALRRDIVWLNRPSHPSLQLVRGDGDELHEVFSCLAMIITVGVPADVE